MSEQELLLAPEERKLRDLLWATHPCIGKYCDDGELQCGVYLPPIDFLRDKPEDIEVKIPLHNAQLAKVLKLGQDSPKLRRMIDKILKSECKAQIACPYDYDCNDHPDCFARELDKILALIPDIEKAQKRIKELQETCAYWERLSKECIEEAKKQKSEVILRQLVERLGYEISEGYIVDGTDRLCEANFENFMWLAEDKLVEGKREEREGIIEWVENVKFEMSYPNDDVIAIRKEHWQALKEGKQ